MCDEQTERDLDELGVSRRSFAVIAGSVGLVAAFPAGAAGHAVKEQDVVVTTPDGQIDAYFVAPAKGRHPAVLIWPDIFGLRPAMRQMGKRLAEAGYSVIVVNPFYRSAKAPITTSATLDQAFRDKVMPMRALLTQDAVMRDATAIIGWLDKQTSVDTRRKIGTQGYCMGGPLVMQTAAAVPGRVGAVASFHGGGLATAAPDSPHLLIPRMKAQFLIAVADNDDKKDPAEKERLRTAFDAAKLPAEIEVYQGAMHGWCPPDSRAYDAAAAEKAWSRLLALYGKALA